ncbi:MAG: response regulator transcription factor, partial [Novosphingobium sp.]
MIPVLVADDHGFIRAGVEAVLRGTQFSVVAATASGEETLDAIKTHDPAIVLLDINMPGMSGWEMLDKLKETHSSYQVSVIIATSSVDFDDRKRAEG